MVGSCFFQFPITAFRRSSAIGTLKFPPWSVHYADTRWNWRPEVGYVSIMNLYYQKIERNHSLRGFNTVILNTIFKQLHGTTHETPNEALAKLNLPQDQSLVSLTNMLNAYRILRKDVHPNDQTQIRCMNPDGTKNRLSYISKDSRPTRRLVGRFEQGRQKMTDKGGLTPAATPQHNQKQLMRRPERREPQRVGEAGPPGRPILDQPAFSKIQSANNPITRPIAFQFSTENAGNGKNGLYHICSIHLFSWSWSWVVMEDLMKNLT